MISTIRRIHRRGAGHWVMGAVLAAAALWPGAGLAQGQLRWATVSQVSQQVEIAAAGDEFRTIYLNEIVRSSDAIKTAPGSGAELRFSDGAIARLGSNTLFRFGADHRLQLDSGTLLLVVPTDPELTLIETPTALTGTHGAALFIRYLPATQTTVVGALTDSPLTVYSLDRTQQQQLRSGQIVTVSQTQIGPVYEFDLATFYQTSQLAAGLAPAVAVIELEGNILEDPLAAVQQNMLDALSNQLPFADEVTELSLIDAPEPVVSAPLSAASASTGVPASSSDNSERELPSRPELVNGISVNAINNAINFEGSVSAEINQPEMLVPAEIAPAAPVTAAPAETSVPPAVVPEAIAAPEPESAAAETP